MPTLVTTASPGDWGANQALNFLLRQQGQLWLALHTSDPNGSLPNEVAGGGYGRQMISFAVPSARICTNSTPFTFSGLVVASVPWLGVWTDVAAGNLVETLDLTGAPLEATSGGLIVGAIGDIAFAF